MKQLGPGEEGRDDDDREGAGKLGAEIEQNLHFGQNRIGLRRIIIVGAGGSKDHRGIAGALAAVDAVPTVDNFTMAHLTHSEHREEISHGLVYSVCHMHARGSSQSIPSHAPTQPQPTPTQPNVVKRSPASCGVSGRPCERWRAATVLAGLPARLLPPRPVPSLSAQSPLGSPKTGDSEGVDLLTKRSPLRGTVVAAHDANRGSREELEHGGSRRHQDRPTGGRPASGRLAKVFWQVRDFERSGALGLVRAKRNIIAADPYTRCGPPRGGPREPMGGAKVQRWGSWLTTLGFGPLYYVAPCLLVRKERKRKGAPCFALLQPDGTAVGTGRGLRVRRPACVSVSPNSSRSLSPSTSHHVTHIQL